MVAGFERISKQGPRAAQLLAATIAALGMLALLATASALVPPQALAGQYHVYSCRMPNGEVAPADGWSPSATGTATITTDTCSQPGGALIAGLVAQTYRTANTNAAIWAFAAPAGETLAAGTFWRAADAAGGAEGGATYQVWLAAPTETNLFDECSYLTSCRSEVGIIGQPFSSANRVIEPAPNLGAHIYIKASCGGINEYNCPDNDGDTNGYAAVLYLYSADLTLEQAAPPTASDVSGELTTAPMLAGTSDVAFSASDPGSGVYQALFSIDGQIVQRTALDENGGHCRNMGQTTDGLPAFLYVQPCLSSVSADVGFDTTRVANGEHHLVVTVADAAGNVATVLDRKVVFDNPAAPGPPNGTNASPQATLSVGWKGTKRDRMVSGFDQAHAVVGRLTGVGGMPIGEAQVDVLSTPAYAGASTAAMPSVRTSASGSFMVHLPAGMSSRVLRFEYSDDVDSPPVVTHALTLSVRAGVALEITPRTSSAGRSIYFSGRLRGGPVPPGGKPLVLEARSPGGTWLEFDVIRSDARGRFHASYRFKFPGPADYQFRVLCEAEADYPFATGASPVIGVYER
jgi:hypothetical protein